MLRQYTELQCSTMPGTGQKVCGVVGVVFKPILVFSLAKAEQFTRIFRYPNVPSFLKNICLLTEVFKF